MFLLGLPSPFGSALSPLEEASRRSAWLLRPEGCTGQLRMTPKLWDFGEVHLWVPGSVETEAASEEGVGRPAT